MNWGNPIGVVPLRATTDCVAEHSTVRQLRSRGYKRTQKFRTDETFAFEFTLFTNFDFCNFVLFDFRLLQIPKIAKFGFQVFKTFALYNAVGPRLIVAGDDPCERTTGHKPAWRA
jgi:hypothetical protein